MSKKDQVEQAEQEWKQARQRATEQGALWKEAQDRASAAQKEADTAFDAYQEATKQTDEAFVRLYKARLQRRLITRAMLTVPTEEA
jgi:ABC-type molybdenum transport system ATPase subunit/photorepair protein PhrA